MDFEFSIRTVAAINLPVAVDKKNKVTEYV
jgi:hypothetical protein